ncbi:MAG: NAD(P)-dependent glycerol-3-phosphate dehydrogenase [Actinomycetota bacterium]|nr:NAD(P)-dependent glycerol-3-phosphate dehydrogenase [Actinomycetota bacterium]MDA8280901.1 NAD(P)-dependent glycerol-3-phosphate dehydrogenase [Actinomycetota bacterium]
MTHRVAVIGAGSWGTTVAAIAARRVPTVIWARRSELAAAISTGRSNPDYLPGVVLPASLRATASEAEAVSDASMIVMAVPSHGFRQVVRRIAPYVAPGVPVLSLSKGLERETNARMTEVIRQELPGRAVGVLSGPNLAREVAAGQPAATVVAMSDEAIAQDVQALLHTERLRIYTNPDVVGCEVAGATKNVLALAAGMSVGMGLGDSSLAALVTRGLAEMGRLVVAMGGDPMTIASLAGVGDLVATCTSPLSRNRSVGVALGSGRSMIEVLHEMRMVAEGVKSAQPLVAMAASYGVEMPIGEQVVAVVDGTCTVLAALTSLMARTAKSEFWGVPVR